jgi:hypothetical protein
MATSSPLAAPIGVTAVQQIIQNEFGWLFREQPYSDHGIDAQIEELDIEERPTGKLVALQIKTGSSYFRKKGNDYVYYATPRHFDYWIHHSLPVYIILHNPDNARTLWQKVERRTATKTPKGWAITIPKTNVLNRSAKQFFEKEIAADAESIRRFNMAFDCHLMKNLLNKEVYFEVNDWVNKSLNIRDIGVMFDETGKSKPDFMIRIWSPARSLFSFMTRYFPWLDYEYAEEPEDAIAGEVVVHVIRVWVNDLGNKFLALEQYFTEGPPEREEPLTPAAQAYLDWEDEQDGG